MLIENLGVVSEQAPISTMLAFAGFVMAAPAAVFAYKFRKRKLYLNGWVFRDKTPFLYWSIFLGVTLVLLPLGAGIAVISILRIFSVSG